MRSQPWVSASIRALVSLVSSLWASSCLMAVEPDYPDSAVAMPGVGDHVRIDHPEPADDQGYRVPIFIALSDDEEAAAAIHGADQLDYAGHVAISVLGVDAGDAPAVLAGLLEVIQAEASGWQADPDALFCVVDDETFYPAIEAFTRSHPDRVQGWLVSCGRFDDRPYPRQPPRLRLAGVTYHPSALSDWGPFIDGLFDQGTLCFDQPLVEEDDGYRLRKMRREKLRDQCAWLTFAWFTWLADPDQRDAYHARLLPAVATERAETSDLWTPNREALQFCTRMLLWPGIGETSLSKRLPERRRAMLAADYAWLAEREAARIDTYRIATRLLADREWRRADQERAQGVEAHAENLARTEHAEMAAHFASIERFASGYQELWERCGDQRRQVRLAPAFAGLYARFMRQHGGHDARDVAWRLETLRQALWPRRLRLPAPRR